MPDNSNTNCQTTSNTKHPVRRRKLGTQNSSFQPWLGSLEKTQKNTLQKSSGVKCLTQHYLLNLNVWQKLTTRNHTTQILAYINFCLLRCRTTWKFLQVHLCRFWAFFYWMVIEWVCYFSWKNKDISNA